MMERLRNGLTDGLRLVYLSARWIGGRWFWILALLPLLWPAFLILRLLVGWRTEAYLPHEADFWIIGLPLSVLAVGLGVRVIAGEIDRRTLEIAYTVPGGAHRVWLAKLLAASLILVAAEGLLAGATAVFLTGFPLIALYPPLQAAVTYLVLAMALSALFKSEVTGALATIPLLFFGIVTQEARVSPFFSTVLSDAQQRADPAEAMELLAHAVQNRIGYLLVIAALCALAFARAERREKMMGG